MDGDGSDNYISMGSHCIFEMPKKKSKFCLGGDWTEKFELAKIQ